MNTLEVPVVESADKIQPTLKMTSGAAEADPILRDMVAEAQRAESQRREGEVQEQARLRDKEQRFRTIYSYD